MSSRKFYIVVALSILSYDNLVAQTYDADAQVFFSATGITDATQKNAVNQLVLDLKNAAIWSKMRAIYPMVGATATTHSYNLKNPSQYQIIWTGTTSNSSNGVLFNGGFYGNTGLTPSNTLSQNSTHLSYYSKTDDGAQPEQELGVYYNDGTNYHILRLLIEWTNGHSYVETNNDLSAIGAVVSNTSGFFCSTRTDPTAISFYRNGTSVATSNITSDTPPNSPLFIGASGDPSTPQNMTHKTCAFASVGDGLSSTEVAAFNTAVQNFECALSRSVDSSCPVTPPPPTPSDASSVWIRSGLNVYNSGTGNVGIGTPNPTQKLSVNGTLLALKVKVSAATNAADWPDYVFDKKYKLPSLDEIEKYTKLNKHLPGIPSAQQVMKNGIDLGSNQALLLKKIEELTLISIIQNKEIKLLKRQVKSLSNKR